MAIPYGNESHQALVDTIVRNTLYGRAPNEDVKYTHDLRKSAESEQNRRRQDADPFYQPFDEYPDLVVDCIVKDEKDCGYRTSRR